MLKRKKKKPVLSMDMGTFSIKCVVAQDMGDKIKVMQAFRIDLPEGFYEDGRLLRVEELQNLLTTELKSNQVKYKDVILTFTSSEVIKRELSIPDVEEGDREEMISYEVSQYLPINVEDFVIQSKPLKRPVVETTEGQEKTVPVLIAAAPKNMVKEHFDFLKDCGLNPVALDIHSNACEKLLDLMVESGLYSDDYTQKELALIDFGHQTVDIAVYKNSSYCFDRSLKMGGRAITEIVHRHLNIPHAEAASRKEKFDVHVMAEAANASVEEISDTDYVLQDTIEYLGECIDEMNKIFRYYMGREVGNRVDKVYFYGGSAELKGFSKLASERLNIPCERLNIDLIVVDQTKMLQSQWHLYANAIGAVIRA